MHFSDDEQFIDFCFRKQQFSDIDLLVATDWRYDADNKLCQVTLLNPWLEQQSTATIEVPSKNKLQTLRDNVNARYVDQFPSRIQNHKKPTHQVVAEYDDWSEFRDVWFMRDSHNILRVSVPLLFDLRDSDKANCTDVFVTLYVTKSQEFYRFAIAELTKSDMTQLKQEMKQLIEEAYARS